MLQFIHLTDPHLVPPGEALYGLDPGARLRSAVADIARRHSPGGPAAASFAVVTGDLTHHGRPESYALLRDILAELPMPAHLLVGNHDERGAFRAAFPDAPVDSDGFVQRVLDTAEARLILLDTKWPGTAAGGLCARRLSWLAARLEETAAPVLLFLHHPPVPVGIHRMDQIALLHADELAAVLEPHRSCIRHIFHGHVHRPIAGSWRGIPLSSVRGTSHQIALDLREMSVVPGSHEPPGYALVRVTKDHVVVHTHDFLDTTANFHL